ncbi:MAG TPA: tryptophan synthase subunit alpha [Cytophagales bacterium]|nr:tryptophan synthase subunit alpha [Cytophagales bacterium]
METLAINKNRLDTLFERKKENVLNVYFTAGFPRLEDTKTIIETLEESGVDIVEIGIPFSDPIADGPTIQQSNDIALGNGMTIKKLFEQIKDVRETVTIPILLMGYINPIIQYGIERFCEKCKEIGIDGLILPDLPLWEYENIYKPAFEKNGLYNIFLITPQTSVERIKSFDRISKGFIYAVSSASTTGAKTGIEEVQEVYFKKLKSLELKNPFLIGFGISDNHTFSKACKYSNGAIIGSAFIKVLEKEGDMKENISKFIKAVRS